MKNEKLQNTSSKIETNKKNDNFLTKKTNDTEKIDFITKILKKKENKNFSQKKKNFQNSKKNENSENSSKEKIFLQKKLSNLKFDSIYDDSSFSINSEIENLKKKNNFEKKKNFEKNFQKLKIDKFFCFGFLQGLFLSFFAILCCCASEKKSYRFGTFFGIALNCTFFIGIFLILFFFLKN